jgi:hypothetical protein
MDGMLRVNVLWSERIALCEEDDIGICPKQGMPSNKTSRLAHAFAQRNGATTAKERFIMRPFVLLIV